MTAITAETQAAALFNLAGIVDELGFVKAQIAELELKEKVLKAALIASGRDKIPGALYDASVSLSERESISIKKLREAGHGDLIKPYITVSDVETVRVTAKK